MFGSSKLLYIKVAEQIVGLILTGEYSPGDKMATVRDLAHGLKVNPLTIQKAYALLEEEKIVIAKVGSGKYVTTDQKIIDKIRIKMMESITVKFLEDCKNYGLSHDEIVKLIEEYDVTN